MRWKIRNHLNKISIFAIFIIICFLLCGFSEVQKYYIYINGERYAEIPKEYDIRHDVNIISNPDIDKQLQFKAGTDPDGQTIYMKQYIANDFNSALFKKVLRHELRQVKRLEEEDFWEKFKAQTAQVGLINNPYEVDARKWAKRTDIIFQLIDKFAVELQQRQEQGEQQKEKYNYAIEQTRKRLEKFM